MKKYTGIVGIQKDPGGKIAIHAMAENPSGLPVDKALGILSKDNNLSSVT